MGWLHEKGGTSYFISCEVVRPKPPAPWLSALVSEGASAQSHALSPEPVDELTKLASAIVGHLPFAGSQHEHLFKPSKHVVAGVVTDSALVIGISRTGRYEDEMESIAVTGAWMQSSDLTRTQNGSSPA